MDETQRGAAILPAPKPRKGLAMDYVTFAQRFAVSVADAYVLPALFERSAQLAKLPVRALLAQATYTNHGLGLYMADRAKVVADADRAAH